MPRSGGSSPSGSGGSCTACIDPPSTVLPGPQSPASCRVRCRPAFPRRGVPVGDDGGGLDEEHVAGVRPLVDRCGQPVEVRPPERLVLPAVVAERGGEHRVGLLVGRALASGRVAGEGEQGGLQRVGILGRVVRRSSSRRVREVGWGVPGDAVLRRPLAQPARTAAAWTGSRRRCSRRSTPAPVCQPSSSPWSRWSQARAYSTTESAALVTSPVRSWSPM